MEQPSRAVLARTVREGPGARKGWRRRRTGTALPALATGAALLVSGCGGGADAKQHEGGTSASITRTTVTAKPSTVEKLGSSLGCKADITTEVDDYRSGVCKTAKAQYAMYTFTADKGQRDWLEVAQMYGGSYLIGKRWVIAAKPAKALEAARSKLGGKLETTGSFGRSPTPEAPAPSPSGSAR